MVFAAELARLTGHLDDATVDRHRSILESTGAADELRTRTVEGLLATMRRDKKARAGMLRFIILDGVGKPVTLEGPEDHLLFNRLPGGRRLAGPHASVSGACGTFDATTTSRRSETVRTSVTLPLPELVDRCSVHPP